MATIQQIIDWAKRKKQTSESNANLIIDLNSIQDDMYTELNSYRIGFSYFDTISFSTVAGTLNFTLPSNCDIDNIITVQLSNSDTITSATVWEDFVYAGVNDTIDIGNYYGKGNDDGELAVIKDGLPIQTSDLVLRIFYNPSPAIITELDQIPDLELKYHNIYKYALVQSIASQGDSPDIEIANYWQQKYDELMIKIKQDLSDKYNINSDTSQQATEWW